MAQASSPVCPSCGGRKTHIAKLCRPCQGAQAKSFHPCPGCGKRIQRAAAQCRECYDKTRELKRYYCEDCGLPTKQYASTRYAKRCRPCHLLTQKAQGRQTRMTKGFQTWGAKRVLAIWPCQLCGYSRMVSDVHRLVFGSQGGRYVIGNMVALCVRCHREVHRGLSEAPPAPTEEEIRATITPGSTI
jgi:hypothetical protein